MIVKMSINNLLIQIKRLFALFVSIQYKIKLLLIMIKLMRKKKKEKKKKNNKRYIQI